MVTPFAVHAQNLRQDGLSWEEAAALSRWVVWQTVIRDGRATKLPYSPFFPGDMAASNNPATWGTLAQAREFCPALQAEGIGIMFGALDEKRWLGGIDLDTCRDPSTGIIEPWALDIIRRFKTYTEVSPSGEGVKLFFQMAASYVDPLRAAMQTDTGKQFKRTGNKEHPPGIEFYICGRYFTYTERHVPGTPEVIHRAFLDDLLHLVRVAGPAFARAGSAGEAAGTHDADFSAVPNEAPGFAANADGDAEIWARLKRSAYWHPELNKLLAGDFSSIGHDRSRSNKAMALGRAMARASYSYEEMVRVVSTWEPTAQWAAEKGHTSNGREFRRLWEKASAPPEPAVDEPTITVGENVYPLTEDGIARAFADRYRHQLRYCHHAGSWYRWSGTVWAKEDTDLAFEWARKLCRSLADEPGVKDRTKATLAKASTASSIERFARSDRLMAVTSEVWDRDPLLFGTPIGTVDLRHGGAIEPRPEDHITRSASVGPADVADCPMWLAFLHEATGGDAELIRFLQVFCGYLLTGLTREHALLFIYGPGGNGKSVFLNTIAGIMAGYATTAPMDTLTASSFDRHPTDMAMLRGARLVSASETEEGRPWAEAKIKQLTGGDPISARFMRQDFFTYLPEFKLTVIGNHKPTLRNVDEAARRRFNVLPFENRPAKPDRTLEAKIKQEWPGVLRWMIDGCLLWQAGGLVRPKAVIDATDEYMSEQDNVRQWIEECCDRGDRNVSDTTAALFKSWTDYALANGEKPGTTRWFTQTLQRHGCEGVRETPGHRGKRGFLRISVKLVATGNQWQNREDY